MDFQPVCISTLHDVRSIRQQSESHHFKNIFLKIRVKQIAISQTSLTCLIPLYSELFLNILKEKGIKGED